MAKARWLAVCSALLFGGAIVGCGTPDNKGDDERTAPRRSALTTSLFQPYVAYPTGSMPRAVAIGDLDGDGRNDIALVTASYFDPANDYMLHVFLQDADGSLKPRVKYPLGLPPSSIDIGDVNGDGRADVVVATANLVESRIGVFLQNPSGALDPMVSYAGSGIVKIGDFNGDGRMDVARVEGGQQGDGLDVFLQTESGSLAPPIAYQVPHGILPDLEAGDIDGDGRTDLVVMSGDNSFPHVNVLLQSPDGVFGAPTSYSLGGGVLTRGVGLGDTNGDGRSDIVVSYGGNVPISFIARFLQNAQGEMAPAVSYASYDSPAAIVVTDVDSDGRKDVVLTHLGGTRMGVYRQYPSGDFIKEELYPTGSGSSSHPQALAVGDINGDGLPDVVIADMPSGLVVLRHVNDVSLALSVTAPVGGSFYTGVPITVRWAAGDNVPLVGFDVFASSNNGATYTPIAGCTGLPAAARECLWASAGPAGAASRVRVTARDGAGQTASAEASISLVAPSITVTGPSPVAYTGTSTSVTWAHNLPASETVRIELSRDGGGSFETLADAAPNTGSFSWSVTGASTTSARVRVTSNARAVSATGNTFAIVTPVMTVTAPAPGATAYTSSLSVAWTTNVSWGFFTVRIEVSRDGGATFETVAPSVPIGQSGNGTFTGSVPSGPDTTNALVRVTANPGPLSVSGTSASFTLLTPSIAVTSPQAGATFIAGTTLPITWSTNLPAASFLLLSLSRDGGSTFQILTSPVPNTGSFAWTVTGPTTSSARVRVSSGGASATSDAFAIFAPSLTVTGPAPALGYAYTGTSTAITWSHNLPATDTVRVELSRDFGGSFQTLAAAAPNSGSFIWEVAGPNTSGARVRVTSNSFPVATSTGANFQILAPVLTITAPLAGATVVGTSILIGWNHNLVSPPTVRIELSRDGGATFETLAAAAPSGIHSGTFTAFVSGPDTTNALVRLTANGAVPATRTSGIFSISAPTLTVTSPATGATLYAGTTVPITWSTNLPASALVRVELSRDGGSTFQTLATGAPNTGSFAWAVTGPPAAAALARITVSGTSTVTATSETFAIVTPSLTVTSPAAGAVLFGSWLPVAWTSNLPSETTVLIELSRDGGATFETFAAAAPTGPAGGSFTGFALGPDTTNAVVRVTTNGPVVAGGTSASFAMLAPALTVTGPGAGATVFAGTPLAITWSTNLPATSPVRVEISRDGGSTFEILAEAAPNTGSLPWVVSGPDAAAAIVRVTAIDPFVSSTSGAFAIVTPSLTVTAPVAGTLAYAGTPLTIAWTHNLSSGDTVAIELTRDGGNTFETLDAAAPNTGSFVWIASSPDAAEARVRVTSTDAASASHLGPAFQIVTPTLAVTAPAAGASWAIGTARTISWSSNLPADVTVRVDLSRDNGASWTTLASAAPASGNLGWTATAPATTSALVRVSADGGVPAVGTSGTFAIGNPALAVTSPVAGAKWTIGAAQTITWTTNLLPTATVKVQLSRNGGSTYTTLASAAPNSGSFVWTATGSATTTAIVRLSANGFTATGVSGAFSLVAGSVTVTSPNTAVTWTVGTVRAITWNHNAGAGAQFMIEVSRSGVWSVITSATPGGGATSGSYAWTVAGPKTTNAKIRVTWTGNTAAKDTSDASFRIN